MTGQTQLDELVELSMSKKPQLLSDPQTQITTRHVETGELVIEAHTYTHTLAHALTYIHTQNYHYVFSKITAIMYVCMYVCMYVML